MGGVNTERLEVVKYLGVANVTRKAFNPRFKILFRTGVICCSALAPCALWQ